jgi:hypothetical protein
MPSNELSMPFAQWLYLMSEAGLAPQARELAIYAVAFKVTSNEELARLSGMDTIVKGQSIADKTYNRWKKQLTDDGWVILQAVTKGRMTSIEVFPAFQETAVRFTDLIPRLARKFYDRNDQSRTYEETVEDTAEHQSPNVEVTDEGSNFYGDPVTVTEPSRALVPACLESSLREDSYTLEVVSEEKEEDGADAPGALSAQLAFESYNDLAMRVGLPLARTLTPERRRSILKRMRDNGGHSAWQSLLSNVERSAFLQGDNDRGWRVPGLDWLLKSANFTKVIEGTYGNGAHAQPKETNLERIRRLMGGDAPVDEQGRLTHD